MKQLMYTVYILQLSGIRKKIYIGFTSNLERRLSEHNKGSVRSTRNNFVTLLHSETFESKKEAEKREKWLKSGVGREWIKTNINGLVAKW